MSIMHCDEHGSWDSDLHEECPRCFYHSVMQADAQPIRASSGTQAETRSFDDVLRGVHDKMQSNAQPTPRTTLSYSERKAIIHEQQGETDTPKVDREEYTIKPTDVGFKAISPSLGRILERSLTAKEAELTTANEMLDRAMSEADAERTAREEAQSNWGHAEDRHAQTQRRAEKAEQRLAAVEAAVSSFLTKYDELNPHVTDYIKFCAIHNLPWIYGDWKSEIDALHALAAAKKS